MNQIRIVNETQVAGFTLVEIPTVIVIIGILASIAIPAITAALRAAKETAIRVEIDVMSQSLEAYKLEHGDYPPDFSDWDAVERHFRNAFPGIDNNELRILSQFTHYNSMMQRTGEATGSPPADPRPNSGAAAGFDHYPHAIDRAEALVFCLGGYSKDKKFPLTGQGGPLVKMSSAPPAEPDGDADDYTYFQYNSEREEGFFDFDPPQLTVALVTPTGGGAPFAYSNDEGAAFGATSSNDLGFVYHPDPFPAYRPVGSEMPIVYFSSTSYQRAFGVMPTATTGGIAWNGSNTNIHHFSSVYMPAASSPGGSALTGAARPYASNIVDTTPPTTMAGFPIPSASTVLQFVQDSKFQLISAGLDNNYGGTLARDGAAPSLAGVGPAARGIGVFPSGEAYNPLFAFSPSGDFVTISASGKFQDDLVIGSVYLSPPNQAYTLYSAQPQLDNITNFSTRTLESDLP